MSVATLRSRLKKNGIQTNDLNDRESAVLQYILRCHLSGYVPPYADIASGVGFAHASGVVRHICALTRKRYLDLVPRSGYQLTDKALNLVL